MWEITPAAKFNVGNNNLSTIDMGPKTSGTTNQIIVHKDANYTTEIHIHHLEKYVSHHMDEESEDQGNNMLQHNSF